MTIKIDLKKPEIDVEIGGLKFKYDYSDKSVDAEREKTETILKRIKSINESSDLDEINKQLKEGFELYLGEGSYEQIYNLAPSVMEMGRIFLELRNQLEDELTKRGEMVKKTQQERVKKYNKKKR